MILISLLALACAKEEAGNEHANGVFEVVSDRHGIASVFSNAGSTVQEVTFTGKSEKLHFPPTSTRLIAVMPALGITEGRANSVRMEIPANQYQSVSGVDHMRGNYYYSKAAAADNPVKFQFAPMGGTIVMNIAAVPGEELLGVKLTQSTSGIAGATEMDLFKNSSIGKIAGGGKSISVSLEETYNLNNKATLFLHTSAIKLTNIDFKIITAERYYQVALSSPIDFTTPGEKVIDIDIKTSEVFVGGVKDQNASVLKSDDGDFKSLLLLDEVVDQIDRIPDFSRVGYKYGDEPIPSPTVTATIDVASISAAIKNKTASDTTDYFQQVLDKVGNAGGGAILVKNGTYNVSRILFIDKDNVVLRGESTDRTIIKNNSSIQGPVIYVGRSQPKQAGESATSSITFVAGRRVRIDTRKTTGTGGNASHGEVTLVTYTPLAPSKKIGANSLITEDYVPLGRLWVQVANPKLFKVGDPVRIYRKSNTDWLTDIGMDRIPDNGRETYQWDLSTYTFAWTRKVTDVRGNRIYLDAPVPMSLESRYGGAELQHYSWNRVKGCGVENLTIDCKYDNSLVHNGKEVDEAHAWRAVLVGAAEHCWIRNVTSKHMGYSLADMRDGARCITVENCRCLTPVSIVSGSRRYAYCISKGAELCLVKNCYCEDDRHSFVTNGPALGPNVFTECESVNGNSSIGPHWGWATSTLYDCVVTDSPFEAQDGSHQGTGHGWRGVNTVFWNVSTTKNIVCQNVWGTCFKCGAKWNQTSVCKECGEPIVPSGRNYAVGCTGTKKSRTVYYHLDYLNNPTEDYFVNLYGYGSNGENRPDGEWFPSRMYEEGGGTPIMLPYEAPVAWWPVFTITSFSKPKSLYQCQLEDRHARGIYLNNL